MEKLVAELTPQLRVYRVHVRANYQYWALRYDDHYIINCQKRSTLIRYAKKQAKLDKDKLNILRNLPTNIMDKITGIKPGRRVL